MTLVLDNSVAVEWLVGGPSAQQAGELIGSRFEELWAPALFWSELAYVLGKRVRRRLMTRAFRNASLRQVVDIGVQTDSASALPGPAFERALLLCDDYDLSIYDAVYLELALRRGGALATLDLALAEAARAAGVDVLLVPQASS